MTDLTLYTHPPHSGGKAKSIVVLIHGYGANGRDLIALAREWAPALPDTVFVSPDAPHPCEAAFGMPGSYQWFSLQSWHPKDLLQGLEAAAPILNAAIDAVLEQYEVTDENLALVGFSQGTMMSLYAAPRRAGKVAGIVGYSGALLGDPGQAPHRPPVHLVHGQMDTVVPVMAYFDARSRLESAGYKVTGHVSPALGHSIDDQGIRSAAEFLKEIFS